MVLGYFRLLGGHHARKFLDIATDGTAAQAGARLKAAEGFMKAHKSELFYEETLKALWGYLSDKLNMPASQLTRQNIVDTLSERGVETAVTDKVINLLDKCEMARYTPDSSLDSSVEALYNEATDTINAMEKAKLTR